MADDAQAAPDIPEPPEVPGPEAQPRGLCLPPPETPPPPAPSSYTSWGPRPETSTPATH